MMNGDYTALEKHLPNVLQKDSSNYRSIDRLQVPDQENMQNLLNIPKPNR